MKLLTFLLTVFFLFISITPLSATSIDLGTSLDSGAVDSRTLVLNAETEIYRLVSLYAPSWRADVEFNDPIVLKTELQYSETEGDVVKNNGFFRAGYDPRLDETWSLWFFEEIGYRRLVDHETENFAGGGIKYRFFKNTSVSFGGLHHYLEIENLGTKNVGRWSLRFKTKNSWGGIVIFYQPDIRDYRDYILRSEAYIKHQLDNRYIKFSINDQYRTSWECKNELSTMFSVGIEF